MKILTWNIQWGLGMDGRCDLGRIARTARDIADFDVLCLQELSDGMPDLKDCPGNDQFAAMAALLPGYEPVDGVAVDVPGQGTARRRRFGNMVLSRLPVGRVLRHMLPWGAETVQHMPRMLIEVVVHAPFGPLRVMTTHLEWSSSALRAAQVEAIREVHRAACARVATPPQPAYGPYGAQVLTRSAVLTGDFNMGPDDPVKQRIEAPQEDGVPALRDTWNLAHPGEPHPPSFCIRDQTNGPPHCCDFIFASEDLAPRVEAVEVFGEVDASDHQPVLLTLAD
jgi:endonuclease/exonuclease/phosphatase family metal-dependent hydrolase